MKWLYMVFLECARINCLLESTYQDRLTACRLTNCYRNATGPVCGIRNEKGGVRVRVFENECDLQEYGCRVSETEAYSSVNMDYCSRVFDTSNSTEMNSEESSESAASDARPEATDMCDAFHCSPKNTKHICALRKDGDGYRVRLFLSQCDMLKHNCAHSSAFNETDLFVCEDLDATSDDEVNENLVLQAPAKPNLEHIIVINAKSMKYRRNLNESVEEFFAATHRNPLTLDEVPPETRRSMVLKTASPVVIFKPWVRVPKNKSDDHWHRPTLSSCYHKCPTKCPETYTPVCGVPGVVAREPSLIFQNHCFMDKAQCKMFWEDKSPTSESSNYVEGSFIFCLGDELTSLYRFLPLIKTLQRMGRLKQRGKFRYKLRNLRFVNNLVVRNAKIMG